jgi:hypothetical protein
MATGFSRFYPAGEGLLEYRTQDEALGAIAAVNADYPRHSRAARAVAADHFGSDAVIGSMMDRL